MTGANNGIIFLYSTESPLLKVVSKQNDPIILKLSPMSKLEKTKN